MFIGKLEKFIKAALCVIISALLIWLFAKYIFPLMLPLLLAFLTAWFLDPLIRGLNRTFKFRRSFASSVCAMLLFFLLLGIIAFAVSRLVYQVIGFVRELPTYLSVIPSFLHFTEARMEKYISSVSPDIREYIISAADSISSKITELPGLLSEKLIAFISSRVSHAPKTVLFCTTYIIGVFFISADYGKIKTFILRQIPLRHRETARNIKNDLAGSFIKWLKAEIILITITFFELLLSFTLLGIPYAGLIALAAALIDALPIFGTGTLLIPWSVVLLLRTRYVTAAEILATWCISALARSFLEPKLVGREFGVHPAAALFAIYAGFRLWGIFGMIIFPLALMMLKELNDKGYVKLWK